jgi:5-methylcytosine-specific restriction endonuclease McrA
MCLAHARTKASTTLTTAVEAWYQCFAHARTKARQCMQFVFVVDTEKAPQSPIHPAAARKLLRAGQAAVWRRYPFTLILKTVAPGPLFAQSARLKIDPGATTTGLAILQGDRLLWAAELTHRGQRIKARLDARRALRRSRRQRKTRYRAPRFLNRTRPDGWLPPSLASRVANILTWVRRLQRLCPLGAISQELVRFDTQLMQNPDISGVDYQQGTLAGYELREYLLEKWHRTCAYCRTTHVPLQVEHIIPRARGGSNRVSNLTLACGPCNDAKDDKTAAEFGHPEVQAQARTPLAAAAAVNTTRWALYRQLQTVGMPVEVGTGGRTRWNRTRLRLPKTHWLDAVAVGASTPDRLRLWGITPLQITAMGHGTRQRCQTDRYGFPKAHRSGQKRIRGFQTGDVVVAVKTRGAARGTWRGRVTVRATGKFSLQSQGRRLSVSARDCRRLAAADGYRYAGSARGQG